MVKHFKYKDLVISLYFRHRWDTKAKDRYTFDGVFREYSLGIWFKKNKMVGEYNFKTPTEWYKHLIGYYQFGINLLFCATWISISKGAKTFKV